MWKLFRLDEVEIIDGIIDVRFEAIGLPKGFCLRQLHDVDNSCRITLSVSDLEDHSHPPSGYGAVPLRIVQSRRCPNFRLRVRIRSCLSAFIVRLYLNFSIVHNFP